MAYSNPYQKKKDSIPQPLRNDSGIDEAKGSLYSQLWPRQVHSDNKVAEFDSHDPEYRLNTPKKTHHGYHFLPLIHPKYY